MARCAISARICCASVSVGGLLQDRPAWYVLGPLIGLVVIGLLWTINQRIGVLGGYSNVVERATGRTGSLGWKAWFLFGVLGGGGLFRLLSGTSTVHDGYGWLTREFSEPTTAALLVGAGALIGFGAQVRGRLHVGQRARRDVGGVGRRVRGHRDVHGGRDRGVVPAEGDHMTGASQAGPPRPACDASPAVKAVGLGFGVVFGFLISWGQFTDPDRIRDMLLLNDLYLYAMMFSAMAIGDRRGAPPAAPPRAGTRERRAGEARALEARAPPRDRRRGLRARLGGRGHVPGPGRGADHPGRVVGALHGRRHRHRRDRLPALAGVTSGRRAHGTGAGRGGDELGLPGVGASESTTPRCILRCIWQERSERRSI